VPDCTDQSPRSRGFWASAAVSDGVFTEIAGPEQAKPWGAVAVGDDQVAVLATVGGGALPFVTPR